MIRPLRALLMRWFSPASTAESSVVQPPPTGDAVPTDPLLQSTEPLGQPVAYNENLLEQARTHWQLGEWQSLTRLDRHVIQHHPDRARLALLAAAGRLEMGQIAEAKPFLRLAQDWGISKKLISQILAASLHGTLGRAQVICGIENKAGEHFEAALRITHADADYALSAESRVIRESTALGLLPQAAKLMSAQLKAAKRESEPRKLEARLKILETEVSLLNHELSLTQQRQQLYGVQAEQQTEIVIGSQPWKERLRKRSVSQLGQDLWALEKTAYKRSGFFVEFGATDGVLLSNTWLLEKEFDWKGICAEPNPKFFEQLKKNRDCIVSNQYIGRTTGEKVEFILADAYGGSKEFAGDDMHTEKRNAYAEAGHTTMLTSISLDEFLKQHNAPYDIDYMSIDTEGSEYSVLVDFPFEKWNIKLLTIEHNHTPQRAEIKKLLKKNGYTWTECEWDDWFEKNNNPLIATGGAK